LEALDEIRDLMLKKDDVTGDDFDFFQDCVFRALDELIDS